MKRILWLVIAAGIISAALFFYKPLILSITKRQLKATCKDAIVSLGDVSLSPFGLTILNIAITKPQVYEAAIGRVSVDFSVASLLKGLITKVTLSDTRVSVATPQKNITQLKDYFHVGSPGLFKVQQCGVLGLSLDIKTKDLVLKAEVSCQADLIKRLLSVLTVSIVTFQSQGLKVDQARVSLVDSEGDLHIRKILYNKLVLEEIKGRVRVSDKAIVLAGLSAQALQGIVQADLSLGFTRPLVYEVKLKAAGVDLERAVEAFDLKKKFRVDGKLGGSLEVKGSDTDFTIINGGFDTASPGGRLTITDTQFLQRLATTTQQSLDMVADSFKEYLYQSGKMRVSLQGGDISLDIMFSGDSGKRNLNITLHDFSVKDLAQYFKKIDTRR